MVHRARLERVTSARGERGQGRERGAAMLEFGLVAGLFFLIVFGMIDGGLLIRARTVTADAADDAARRGAVAATAPSADYQILEQVKATGILSNARVNHVVVYRVDKDRTGPLPECQLGTAISKECNVYTLDEFDLPVGAFNCSSAELDGSWCPDQRLAESREIGVWIDATYDTVTGVFGDIGLGSASEVPIEDRGSRQ